MARLSDLIDMITLKTMDRKIQWSSDDDGGTIWSKFEANTLEISKDDDFSGNSIYELKLRNRNGEVVEAVYASRSHGSYSILENLHEEARRQALKIDIVINELQNILQKL